MTCNFGGGNTISSSVATIVSALPSTIKQLLVPPGVAAQGTLPSLAAFTALTSISLPGLGLTGTIPFTSMTRLINLTYIDLSNNALNGTIGDIWTSVTSVTFLSLAYNNLNGTLPLSLGNLMASIQVNGNAGLTGPVPYDVLTNCVDVVFFFGANSGYACEFTNTALTLPPAFQARAAFAALNASLNTANGTTMPTGATAISTLTANVLALNASNAALGATIAALNATLSMILSGWCPPLVNATSAGRHLLTTQTPVVPPTACAPASPSPPAQAQSVAVTVSMTLSGINLATFSLASVTAALAAAAGVSAAAVSVVVTDYPLSTTIYFTGVAMTTLTPVQVTGITAAISASLPIGAIPTLGTVASGGRRLLDLGFPVVVTGIGNSSLAVAQAQSALTSPTTLGAVARAAGVPPSAVTATTVTVSAALSVSVQSASTGTTTAALTNVSAVSAQLAASGVTITSLSFATTAVYANPSSVTVAASTNRRDLLALLVLIVVVAAPVFSLWQHRKARILAAQAKSSAAAAASAGQDSEPGSFWI